MTPTIDQLTDAIAATVARYNAGLMSYATMRRHVNVLLARVVDIASTNA